MSTLAFSATPTTTTNSTIDCAKRTMWLPEGQRCQIMIADQPCTAILSCWEAYRLHLIHQHCTMAKKKHGQNKFYCPFRCPNYVHASHKSLENHITISHMAKIPLLCPFQKCNGLLLDSEILLLDHIQSDHTGESLDAEGELLPSWWSPSDANADLPPPPLLPSHFLNPLVVVTPSPFHPPPTTPRTAPRVLTLTDTLPSMRSPLNRSLIQRRITLESLGDLKITDEKNFEYEFADLPILNEPFKGSSSSSSSSSWRPQRSEPEKDWVVWERPAAWKRENPRPFHLLKPEDYGHTPPGSILFHNVFSGTSRSAPESK